MAYFLKKTTLKGRTYLSIVESFYSHEKRGAAHRTYKSLASVETWKAKGIEDPIAHFQKEVDELNSQRKNEGVPKISTVSPELYLGYFPFVSLMNKMNIKKYVDYVVSNECRDAYDTARICKELDEIEKRKHRKNLLWKS